MIDVKAFTLGDLTTNCYLLEETISGEMAVVDPATEEIIDILKSLNCDFSKIKYIFLTHAHFDHIYGTAPIKELTNAEIVISRVEKPSLGDNDINLSSSFLPPNGMEKIVPDMLVDDGSIIKLGNTDIKIMLTPGHTAGSICLLFEDNLISGDTLFCESVGRTDLPTGDMNMLLKSLGKIKAIDGNCRVYPGHGRPTTLDHERKYNIYMD